MITTHHSSISECAERGICSDTAEVVRVRTENERNQFARTVNLRIQLQAGKIRLIQVGRELVVVHTTRIAHKDALGQRTNRMRAKDEADRAQLHSSAGMVMIAVPISRPPVKKVKEMLVKDLALARLQFMAFQNQLKYLATRGVHEGQLIRSGCLAGDDFSERRHR